MNATPARRPTVPSAEMILQELSTRQFVRPHRPLAEALADAGAQLGFCQASGARAAAWLELDPAAAIGRLRRAELAQLAQSIRRFCCQESGFECPGAEIGLAAATRPCAGEAPM